MAIMAAITPSKHARAEEDADASAALPASKRTFNVSSRRVTANRRFSTLAVKEEDLNTFGELEDGPASHGISKPQYSPAPSSKTALATLVRVACQEERQQTPARADDFWEERKVTEHGKSAPVAITVSSGEDSNDEDDIKASIWRRRDLNKRATAHRPLRSVATKVTVSRHAKKTGKTEIVDELASMPSLPEPDIVLTAEQQEILTLIMQGHSIFFTGSAGVGKSVLLRKIIIELRKKFQQPGQVGVTSTTGLAAQNIGGVTIHSWSGLGNYTNDAERGFFSIVNSPYKEKHQNRWLFTEVLIIDEVSMLECGFFETLEAVGRRFDKLKRPFGGIQLVLTGDFLQLPPIGQLEGRKGTDRSKTQGRFAFCSPQWDICIPNVAVLNNFVKCLNAVRLGALDKTVIGMFTNLARELYYDDGIEATIVYPLRKQVMAENARRLNDIQHQCFKYSAHDVSGMNRKGKPFFGDSAKPALHGLLDKNVRLERDVYLKVDAQVMLVKNLDGYGYNLYNGSVSRVVGMLRVPRDMAQAQAWNWRADETFEHWENSTHDGQEAFNIMAAETCARVVSEGDARSYLERRHQAGWPEEIKEEAHQLTLPAGIWPIVEFPQGQKKSLTLVFPPIPISAINVEGEIEATRQQVPLSLAWAISIHKSQGQTLERVKVDLDGCFEDGQVYTALSRARNLDNLQVLNFDPDMVTANLKVLEWFRSLGENVDLEIA